MFNILLKLCMPDGIYLKVLKGSHFIRSSNFKHLLETKKLHAMPYDDCEMREAECRIILEKNVEILN